MLPVAAVLLLVSRGGRQYSVASPASKTAQLGKRSSVNPSSAWPAEWHACCNSDSGVCRAALAALFSLKCEEPQESWGAIWIRRMKRIKRVPTALRQGEEPHMACWLGCQTPLRPPRAPVFGRLCGVVWEVVVSVNRENKEEGTSLHHRRGFFHLTGAGREAFEKTQRLGPHPPHHMTLSHPSHPPTHRTGTTHRFGTSRKSQAKGRT